jgi:hypothetical protein
MTHTFNRRRGVQACFVVAMLALATAFIAIGAMFPIRAVGIFAIAFGLVVAGLAVLLALDAVTPDPILAISAEGIRFLPFSPTTVPWRDITSITMTQGYYSNGSAITKPDGKFGFRYSIRDACVYPKGGGVGAVNRALMTVNNTIPLNTLLIDAKWPDMLAALREHYPGTITEVPIPGFPLANP